MILIEEIAMSSAGGKDSIYKLLDMLRRNNQLVYQGNSFERRLVFAVDKDYDDVLSTGRRSQHVIRTRGADVEADIHLAGNLPKALSAALSVTQDDAEVWAAAVGDYVAELAAVWREWIELCVLSVGVRARCSVRPSRHSAINRDRYGTVDVDKLAQAESDIRDTMGEGVPDTKEVWVRARVAGVYRRAEQEALVKGKLLPHYLLWRLKPLFAGRVVDSSAFETLVTHLLLTTIDFADSWSDHYRTSLQKALAS
ncbi:hypothetical protein ACTJJE_11825 [Mycolicibacterium sp. 22603]|uniref:hypothetical protein n=1 Tax=Mycolicibacterium sp. 22603 TaxID=3453950 RepID=UPI003F84BA70